MRITYERKSSTGWQVFSSGVGARVGYANELHPATFDAAVDAAKAFLDRLVEYTGKIAKNLRAVVRDQHGDVVVIVSVIRHRSNDHPKAKSPEQYARLDGTMPRPSQQAFRRSQYSGGMRQSNAFNLIPGAELTQLNAKRGIIGPVTGRGRVMWNVKGSKAKAKAGKAKIRQNTDLGSTGKYVQMVQSIETIPMLTQTEAKEPDYKDVQALDLKQYKRDMAKIIRAERRKLAKHNAK